MGFFGWLMVMIGIWVFGAACVNIDKVFNFVMKPLYLIGDFFEWADKPIGSKSDKK